MVLVYVMVGDEGFGRSPLATQLSHLRSDVSHFSDSILTPHPVKNFATKNPSAEAEGCFR